MRSESFRPRDRSEALTPAFWISWIGLSRTIGVRRCALISTAVAHREGLAAVAQARSWRIEMDLEVARPSLLDELKECVRRGVVNSVVMECLQWPGEGVIGALRRLDALAQLGVDVLSVGEPWFDIAAHRQLLRWLVERLDQEHRSRIRMALSVVRANGGRLGRPRAHVPAERVLTLRSNGASIRTIAREVGLGVSTVQRFLAAQRQGDRHGT